MKGHNLLTFAGRRFCYLQERAVYIEHQGYASYKWVKFLMMVLLSHICTLLVSLRKWVAVTRNSAQVYTARYAIIKPLSLHLHDEHNLSYK